MKLSTLIAEARKLGTISFTEVAGVGWQATIRPPSTSRRSINSWSGQGPTLFASLSAALRMARKHPSERRPSNCEPVLGGAEFDPQ